MVVSGTFGEVDGVQIVRSKKLMKVKASLLKCHQVKLRQTTLTNMELLLSCLNVMWLSKQTAIS